MDIVIFSFTKTASDLSVTLQNKLSESYESCISYAMEKYATCPELTPFPISLKDTVSSYFKKGNVLIFIGACGIAVRSIAPFIEDKTKDPCVLTIDEKAQYVISLLSGHLGGGNDFAAFVADLLSATPIISTATDLNQRFAVDVFAKKNQLSLSDMKIAKKISATLLDGYQVGIDGNISNETLPEGLTYHNVSLPLGFSITPFSNHCPYKETLHLIPRQVVLGIGCKRHTPFEKLHSFVMDILKREHIYLESIACVTSIDLKKEEEAIVSLAKELQVPFFTYSSQELLTVTGDFTSSDFVKNITGVDNVCERSSLAYSHAKELYLRKTPQDGCTIAISLIPMEFHF